MRMRWHVLYHLHIIYSSKNDYSIYRELAGGKGYADVVFVPRRNVNKPAIIVELKWNKTASSAIEQIKNRQYIESLKGYPSEVVLVEVNYDAGGDGDGRLEDLIRENRIFRTECHLLIRLMEHYRKPTVFYRESENLQYRHTMILIQVRTEMPFRQR